MVKFSRQWIVLLLSLWHIGCQPSASGTPEPICSLYPEHTLSTLRNSPNVLSVTPWLRIDNVNGLKISTKHYEIFTTVRDADVLYRFPSFWESAFKHYCRVVDHAFENQKKRTVYIFNDRRQWEDFTRQWCGREANVYLNIQNGGYTFKNACVVYYNDNPYSFNVMGHEGWHQFSGHVFAYRLPAWVDEGLATTFEAYRWQADEVIFDVHLNQLRLSGLKKALAWDHLKFRISELILTDAGHLLNDSDNPNDLLARREKLDTYYAQLYAFIRFLREDNNAACAQALKMLLNDAMTGTWPIDRQWISETTQKNIQPSKKWNKTIGKMIFQNYITTNPSDLEERYRAFCFEITR